MIKAKLEPEFMPMVKVINDYKAAVAKAENQPVVISVERNNSLMAVYKLDVYKKVQAMTKKTTVS